jgi:GDP-L-fucose synthase
MNILITGGSGFIGRNLMEYLDSRYSVLAPSHSELDFLDEDAVREYFMVHGIDVVIHCAVRPGHRNAKDPSNQLYDNLRMFFNIIRNKDRFRKMIYLNSGLVYDMRYYLPKMEEGYFGKHIPIDEGGFSKYIAGKYIEVNENLIDLRIFSIFGKYEDYAIRFISNAICKVIFDLPITIKQNRLFDFIYIEDFFQIIDYFINNKGQYSCYNVSPDNAIELNDVAKKVLKISGKNLPIKIAQSGMGKEYSGDNSRLRREIKNFSLTPIDDAIHKLYSWYYNNRCLINKGFLLFDK